MCVSVWDNTHRTISTYDMWVVVCMIHTVNAFCMMNIYVTYEIFYLCCVRYRYIPLTLMDFLTGYTRYKDHTQSLLHSTIHISHMSNKDVLLNNLLNWMFGLLVFIVIVSVWKLLFFLYRCVLNIKRLYTLCNAYNPRCIYNITSIHTFYPYPQIFLSKMLFGK